MIPFETKLSVADMIETGVANEWFSSEFFSNISFHSKRSFTIAHMIEAHMANE
jgi:hypothetical protein